MATLINPLSVTIVVGVLVALAAWLKPQATRIFLGVFFLIMALGVNVTVSLIDASLYVAAGQNALLPLYRWFFGTVLAWNPVVFVIPLILYEIAVGVLTLSKGRAARWGLLGMLFFCVAIVPVGMEEIGALGMALAAGLLLRHEYSQSLVDTCAGWFKRRANA